MATRQSGKSFVSIFTIGGADTYNLLFTSKDSTSICWRRWMCCCTKRTPRARANGLCLSQSAVSGALARLREYFNDELLVQVGRSFVLTPLAESLIEPVSALLRQIEATIAAKARFDPATSTRRFTIMGSDYAMTVLMTEVLRRVEREALGVTCVLRQTTLTWQEELTRGAIDLLMIPAVFASDRDPRESLFEEKFTCVVWAENALVGKTLSPEQYLALGHVGMAFGQTLEPSIEQMLLQQAGYSRRMEVFAPSFALLPRLVVGTNRVATMHTRLAKLAATWLPLRLLPLPYTCTCGVFPLYWLGSQELALAQDPLHAPTVFNFFEPGHSHPGQIASEGLVSPEFQIANDTSVIGISNFLNYVIRDGFKLEEAKPLVPNFSEWNAIAGNVPQLIDQLDLVLTSKGISNNLRTHLNNELSKLPANEPQKRVMMAAHLILTSPDYVIQK
jgi:DNA-binding transcriptional LysR family regulator